jgi:uncharacterized membrane protein (Fun14 family)
MSIEALSPTLFSIGSGGVIGFLAGLAIKRVIKILAVIVYLMIVLVVSLFLFLDFGLRYWHSLKILYSHRLHSIVLRD